MSIELRLSGRAGPVIAAVSGGADSMTMLRLLCAARKDGRVRDVICAHFNHRLRETAARDEEHVKHICAEWDVTFVSERADVAALAEETGQSVEMAARAARYGFLRRVMAANRADAVLTAHNAGDNAETVLLNLIRGTGLAGLCGIPYEREGIVRPLLHVGREEIMDYVQAYDVPYVTDESNLDTAYRRNELRHAVIPLLERMNPSFVRAVTRMTAHLREDEAVLDALARDAVRQWAGRDGDTAAFPADKLLEAPRPVAFRILRVLAGEVSVRGLETPHMEALLRLCRKGQKGKMTDLPGGFKARRAAGDIMIEGKRKEVFDA